MGRRRFGGTFGPRDPAVQPGYVPRRGRKGCRDRLPQVYFCGFPGGIRTRPGRELKSEDGPAEPVSEYGRAKLMFGKFAENMIERINSSEECLRPMRYVHLRLFSVYGPGDHEGSLVSSLIRKLKAGEAVELGNCGQQWNYLYIDDAAEAIALMCEKFTGGIYNIGGTDTRPLRSYVEELASILEEDEKKELKSLLRFGMRPDNAEGPADLSPDITKLKLMGFEPKVSFADGIRMMLKQYKE
ncbi:MAG: NAD(P)-dependent oxidoreductase [Lachnospiraceae bacterium]|nr:NAD(P)-dependent oxidoreductase [Lachnospiraceae bacterium]